MPRFRPRSISRCIPALLALALAALAPCSGCANRSQGGAGVGTTLGSVIGALTFKDQTQGAVIGAGAGMLVGYAVGRGLDKNEAFRPKPKTPANQATAWRLPEPESSLSTQVSPTRTEGQAASREVTFELVGPDGRREVLTTTALRNPDGSWSLAQ